jgi:hypothetical protein
LVNENDLTFAENLFFIKLPPTAHQLAYLEGYYRKYQYKDLHPSKAHRRMIIDAAILAEQKDFCTPGKLTERDRAALAAAKRVREMDGVAYDPQGPDTIHLESDDIYFPDD